MLDIKLIRNNPDFISKVAQLKWVNIDILGILELDSKRKSIEEDLQILRTRKNQIWKSRNDDLREEGKTVKENIQRLEDTSRIVSKELYSLLSKVPNIPSADTPEWVDEHQNVVLRQWWEIPKFDFEVKEHDELWVKLGLIDTERAAKVVWSRFSYLKWDLALMQFALIQHVFSILTNQEILEDIIKKNNIKVSSKPFTPIVPPILIKPSSFEKMARLEPKEERYHIPSDDLYLIGSAEHTLWAMHMDETFDEKELPVRYIGYSTSMRREAWSSWKDVRWILRQHQFDKLEMESFCLPEDSLEEQNLLVAVQEYLLKSLNLPHQVVICCTWDMWTADARHIDVETWMPWQGKYRETHSADLMTDYQSRRLNIKVKRLDWQRELVHMNDATAFAIWRTLIAIMENYQQKDWTILIPEVLRKYVHKDIIK